MAGGDCRALSQNARQSRTHQSNHQDCRAALRRRGRRGRDVGHRAKSSDAKPNHPVMTFERMWDGPKPPRANLSRPAETVMHILHASEPLKADLSELLILRTCGMAHSYYSLAWQGYTCWSGEEHMNCIGEEHHAKLSRVSVTRQAKAVAHM